MTSCVEIAPDPVNLAVPAKVQLHDRDLTGDLEKRVRTQFSVIVPVFNEAPLIRPFLQHLRERAPGAEIIVADGGSSDGTAQLPEYHRAVWMRSRALWTIRKLLAVTFGFVCREASSID